MELVTIFVFCCIVTLVFAVGGLTAQSSTRQRLDRLSPASGVGQRSAASLAVAQVMALGADLVSRVEGLFEGSSGADAIQSR